MDFQSIECIIYDFDGVMTNNQCLIDQNGVEAVFVNRSDGYAVSQLREMGIVQAIISTEVNAVVEKRAEKLGIPVVYGVSDKAQAVLKFSTKHKIQLSRTMFIGNDLNDMPAFRVTGMKGAPADAEEEILEQADWISSKKGGCGVIRELFREIKRRKAEMEV